MHWSVLMVSTEAVSFDYHGRRRRRRRRPLWSCDDRTGAWLACMIVRLILFCIPSRIKPKWSNHWCIELEQSIVIIFHHRRDNFLEYRVSMEVHFKCCLISIQLKVCDDQVFHLFQCIVFKVVFFSALACIHLPCDDGSSNVFVSTFSDELNVRSSWHK